MTSAPQQPGWPSAEEPPAQQARGGFDLFEAPPVPDSFPVFTPFRADQADEPDYSQDQSPSPFSGFPDAPEPLLSAQSGSQPGEGYVPAPAALPIPGVTHDAAGSGSWPAFSPGKPAEPQDYSGTPFAPAEPPQPAHAYEPAEPYQPARAYEPSQPARASEPAEPYQPTRAYEPAEPFVVPESFADPEPEPVQWSPIHWPSSEQASPEPAPAVQWPSATNDPVPEPVSPAPPVVATARVSAASAVPAVNRATPEEIPAALPKPAPRVYGRPPAAEPEPEAAVVETPSTSDAEQQSRSAARTAVPQARAPQEEQVRQPIARSSTVYGAPARQAEPGQQAPMSPPAPMPQRQSSFSDLIPQGAPQQAPPGMPPVAMPPHGGPGPGGPPFGGRPAPMGAIQPNAMQPNAMQQRAAPAGAPPMVPAQRGPAQPMAEEPSIAIETKPVRSGRLVVLVIGGCVALLAVAFGVLFGVSKLLGDSDETPFKISSCVKQTGGQAVAANCSEAGSFTIISIVGDVSKCADQTQPYVKYEKQVFCLRANK